MKKIGILGGTFNPIHKGHLEIAIQSYWQLGLDEVWIMPNAIPPHKQGTGIAPGKLRVRMISAAIAKYPFLKCSAYELEQEGISYTARTLTGLCEEMPEAQFYYIVGSDSLCYMDQWYHPEEIFQRATIVAAYRSTETLDEILGYASFLREKYDAKIVFIQNTAIDVSSSEIRRRLQTGETVSEMVPEEVLPILQEIKREVYDDPRRDTEETEERVEEGTV